MHKKFFILVLLFITIINFTACLRDNKTDNGLVESFLFLSSLETSVNPIAPDPEHTELSCSYGFKTSSGSTLSIIKSGSEVDKKRMHYKPKEVIVKFRTGVSNTRANNILRASNAKGISSLRNISRLKSSNKSYNLYKKVKIANHRTVKTAIAEYKKNPDIEHAQPNYIYYKTSTTPNDYEYDYLWGLEFIDADEAWDIRTDCRQDKDSNDVIVAVLDTGINYNSRDLAGNMWDGSSCKDTNGDSLGDCTHGYDFIDDDKDPMDMNGHGTHVAGIIGASGNDGIGVTGVCWRSNIMAVRILDAAGYGTTEQITNGIYFAVRNGARVINMSLGSNALESGEDTLFQAAINEAKSNEVIVVAAAGNGDQNNDYNDFFPANYTQTGYNLDNVISVAAVERDNYLASFSNYGSDSVDIGAPGVDILSTFAGQQVITLENFSDWTRYSGWSRYYDRDYGDFLINPSSWPGGYYRNNLDAGAFKEFDLSIYGADGATVSFYMGLDLSYHSYVIEIDESELGGENDAVQIECGNNHIDALSGSSFSSSMVDLIYLEYDLNPYFSDNATVGFNLITNSSGTYSGVGINYLSINRLYLNATACSYFDGTSMAAPYVSGALAMLIAHEDDTYNYLTIINALYNGARTNGSSDISGRKILDADGAINEL